MDGVSITPKNPAAPADQGFNLSETAPVASFLSVDNSDDRLQRIVDYFKEDGKELMEADLLWKIRSLETRLGHPSLGEKRIDKIYRYIKLQSQIDGLRQRRDRELR